MDAILFLSPRQPLPPSFARRLPFALLPLLNRPLLSWLLEGLAQAGVTRALCVRHEEEAPALDMLPHEAPPGLAVEYHPLGEETRLGQAALLARRSGLGEDFLLCFWPHLLSARAAPLLVEHARQKNACTVIAASPGERNGREARDARDSRPALEPAGAICCCNQAVLGVPEALACDALPPLLQALRKAGARLGAVEDAACLPLDSLAAVHKAAMLALRKELPLPRPGRRLAPGVFVGEGCRIHAKARLRPPALLGEGCLILKDAEVGPGVVLAPGTVVERLATVRETVVLRDGCIGPRKDVERAMILAGTLVRVADQAETLAADPHFLGAAPRAPRLDRLNERAQRLLAGLCLLLFLPVVLGMLGLHALAPRKRRLHQVSAMGEAVVTDGRARPRRFRYTCYSSRRLFPRHLPALWDVLAGRLRLVGVEPLPARLAALCRERWMLPRFQAPVGLIPPWAHLHEDGPVSLSFAQKRAMEQDYACNRTPRGDLRLLLSALRQGLRPDPGRDDDVGQGALRLRFADRAPDAEDSGDYQGAAPPRDEPANQA